jgi:hypothetical protein
MPSKRKRSPLPFRRSIQTKSNGCHWGFLHLLRKMVQSKIRRSSFSWLSARKESSPEPSKTRPQASRQRSRERSTPKANAPHGGLLAKAGRLWKLGFIILRKTKQTRCFISRMVRHSNGQWCVWTNRRVTTNRNEKIARTVLLLMGGTILFLHWRARRESWNWMASSPTPSDAFRNIATSLT